MFNVEDKYKHFDEVVDSVIDSKAVPAWKTKSTYYSWLRGGIRRIWGKHPLKMEFLKKKKKKIVNPNPTSRVRFPTVMGCECYVCKKDFVLKEIEVDHIAGGKYTLTQSKDVEDFVLNILFVKESDLRTVCKNCHGILSYQAKQGIKSFEKAKIEKEIIALTQTKAKKFLDNWYKARGLKPETNTSKRKAQIRDVLYNENNLTGGIYD